MCDTFVALGAATPSGAPLFGKNTDREPFEAQGLEWVPATVHEAGSRLFTTYLSLPQVTRTQGVVLSRPYWMWGAEMGLNESGVVAGNEAVFTRLAERRRQQRERGTPPPAGLLGMDVIRLCLERTRTAEAAATLACELIETYGQGGEAGHRVRNFDYDNSFLFADHEAAWTVETAGSAWVRRSVDGIYAISNRLRIREDWQYASAHIAAYARDAGLDPGRGRLDFARTFRDRIYEAAALGKRRRARVEALLEAGRGALTAGFAFEVLRDHGASGPAPRRAQVCAHAGWLPHRRAAQTTGSLVVDFGQASEDRRAIPFWATATAAPCSSLFKPSWLSPDGVQGCIPEFPGARADGSLWWRHQALLKLARGDWGAFLGETNSERRDFEQAQLLRLSGVRRECAAARDEMSQVAWATADRLERRWAAWAARLPARWRTPQEQYLRNLERQANLG